jgi:MFS family permease
MRPGVLSCGLLVIAGGSVQHVSALSIRHSATFRERHLASCRSTLNGCCGDISVHHRTGMVSRRNRNSMLFQNGDTKKLTALAANNNPIDETMIESDNDPPPVNSEVMGPLILLLLSQFLLFIGVGAVIPSIPLYGKELGFSSAANGIVISIPSVALLLLSKLGGNYADRARKPAMIIGMAIIALSDLGTALATGLPTLFIARLGLGAGRCISESGERGMLADLANQIPALRGRALAAQQACVALGIAIGAPIGGIIVEEYGPRAAFLCVTVAAVLATIMYCFLPETIGLDDDEVPAINGCGAASKTKNEESQPKLGTEEANWAGLLSQNRWRGLALCQSGASFGFAAKIAAIPVLATANLPGGAVAAGALLSAAGFSGLIGAPAGGLLTDRAGAKTAAMLSGLLSAVGLILIPVALGANLEDSNLSLNIRNVVLDGNGLAFCAAVVAWSTGAAAQSPALVALAQENAPKGGEATAMALPKAFGDGTYIIVPFVLGLVTDAFVDIPGIECAVAGTATLLGVVGLGLLGDEELYTNNKESKI